jgi:hypothetical protein
MKESTPESEQGSTGPSCQESDFPPLWRVPVWLVALGLGLLLTPDSVARHGLSDRVWRFFLLDGVPIVSGASLVWLLAVAVPLALLVSTVFHECGHLALGSALGLTLEHIRVGLWTLKRSAKRWRLGFDPKASLLSGETHFRPLKLSPRRRWWMVAGGPLANLLSGAGAVVLGWMAGVRPLGAAFWIFALSSLLGVGNLAPVELSSGQLSDGLRMLALGRGHTFASTRAADELFELARLGQRLSSGGVSAEEARAALEEERTSLGRLFLLVCLFDSQEPKLARPVLERAMVEMTNGRELLRVALIHCAAYFAFVEPDPARVHDLLARLPRSPTYRLVTALSDAMKAVAERKSYIVEMAVLRQAMVERADPPPPLFCYEWIIERLWRGGGRELVSPIPRPPGLG